MTSFSLTSAIKLILFTTCLFQCGSGANQKDMTQTASGEISLPADFNAITVMGELGRNRHLAVNNNGDIYVKLERLKDGKGIYVLRLVNGKYEVVNSFGDYGGTGIALKNGYLYASSDESVYRYKMNDKNEVADSGNPEKIVSGLLNQRQHSSKSIALDNAGNIYVIVGAPSNACQEKDRASGSPGQDPCPILEKAGGIWQFKVDKLNQTYEQGVRYATGIRHIVGMDWNNNVNELYAVQHGRDQFSQLFPDLYNDEQNAELPAEEFFKIKQGSDFGWPYCYYDQFQQKKLLGPEYGGDAKKQERCADKEQPILAFPGHWAPNALLFYTGKMFPEKYREGAFVAFHGSWNRAPLKQAGYFVVFVPFKDGNPSGAYEIFANGFAGTEELKSPAQAKYRPCGIAQGPDGALYISDSRVGKIWKIEYKGK